HTRFSRDWSSDVCSSDLDIEVFILISDLPRFRHASLTRPATLYVICKAIAIFLLANEPRLRAALPFLLRQCLSPDSLRFRPDERIGTKAFELFASARVDEFVVFPGFRKTKCQFHELLQTANIVSLAIFDVCAISGKIQPNTHSAYPYYKSSQSEDQRTALS